MFTSERIPHDSGMYHERIYWNDELVAKVMSDPKDSSYWWIKENNQSISRGYKTVADAKKTLFMVLEGVK